MILYILAFVVIFAFVNIILNCYHPKIRLRLNWRIISDANGKHSLQLRFWFLGFWIWINTNEDAEHSYSPFPNSVRSKIYFSEKYENSLEYCEDYLDYLRKDWQKRVNQCKIKVVKDGSAEKSLGDLIKKQGKNLKPDQLERVLAEFEERLKSYKNG